MRSPYLHLISAVFSIAVFSKCNKFRLIEAQKVPAVFMFGDSYGDTGNNDFIPTNTSGNYPPYGKDFKYGIPTGRISNGKLMSDYFVEGLGIKELLPPYLDSKLQQDDLLTGVCFGSAGTGLDNLTAQISSVIPVWKQIDYFKDYTKKVICLVGEEQATTILNEAIFFIVIGTNDFIVNYYQYPTRPVQFTIPEYTHILLDIYAGYIKELHSLGALRIALINVPPLGCLPSERTEGFNESNGACAQDRNEAASGFNTGLNAMALGLKSTLPGLRIAILDYNSLISDIIENPSKYGIEVVAESCCRTGSYVITSFCNKFNPFTCSDASKYIFFDSVHLSQAAYQIISNVFLTRDIPKIL